MRIDEISPGIMLGWVYHQLFGNINNLGKISSGNNKYNWGENWKIQSTPNWTDLRSEPPAPRASSYDKHYRTSPWSTSPLSSNEPPGSRVENENLSPSALLQQTFLRQSLTPSLPWQWWRLHWHKDWLWISDIYREPGNCKLKREILFLNNHAKFLNRILNIEQLDLSPGNLNSYWEKCPQIFAEGKKKL